ncbi:ABC transporter [Cloacibacillus sp. An23]|uniref:ABC transporter permease subunit n=1 Tax=Cloacibacillus sp. An23 TaxID=1965591 RepID=UPI000B38E5D4|nr:ABC transporter [Cloacibacillus sp. An23]OUO93948.1 ABC transporter [Cloacibacillus sp. An23]
MKGKLHEFIENAGWPRIIIALFLLALFVAAPFVGVRLDASISDTLVRVGMNGILVLAMVPMIQSGCGLNFGLPLGIIAGLLGAVTSIQIGVEGAIGFVIALAIAVPIAAVLGWMYGQLLNKVKGDEMMIATYVGFSSVALMCIAWLLLPYTSPTMIWGYGGSGLRTTISVEGFWLNALSQYVNIRIGEFFYIPVGMFLFFAFVAFLVWAFFRTKTGTAITAVGSNPEFARASGINVDKMRTISVVMSTVLGAIGILVYEQSFGFIQLYMGPFYMAFPAVAAILLGGATVNKATMVNVVVGTFLFQGILTMTPSVINSVMQTDMSEVIRIIVSNGMILYALTRKVTVKR